MGWRAACAALVLLALLPAAAQEPRVFVASRAQGPITIDGKFDEPAWKQVTWYGDFVRFDLPGPKVPRPAPTRFALCYDDQNIYWAAEMTEPNTDKLVARGQYHDAQVWTDDSVELFLDSKGDRSEYYHFVVNPKGVVYDDLVRQGGTYYEWQWNTTGKVAAQINEGKSWTVEMSIPLAELEVSSEPGRLWAVNVVRNRQAGTTERSSAAPLAGIVHDPQRFAPLKLSGGDFSRFAWEAHLQGAPQIVALEDGLRVDVKVVLRFLGKRAPAVVARAVLSGGRGGEAENEATAAVDLGADNTCEVNFSLPTKLRGESSLMLEILEGEIVLARRWFSVQVEYAPLRVRLLEPWYKASYFHSQAAKRVVAEVTVGVPQQEREKAKLLVQVRRCEETVAEKEIPSPGVRQEVSLDTPGLAVGTYEVLAQLLSPEGKALHKASARFTRRDQWRGEVWVDRQRATLLDGNRFLPFGWFGVPSSEFERVADSWCNTVVAYGMASLSEAQRKAYLDRAYQAGLKVIMEPYDDPALYSEDRWRQPLTDEEKQSVRNFVRRYKSHPALLGWYLADEPERVPANRQRLETIYRLVSDEDPYHPCLLVNQTCHGMWIYGESCDILMPDPHPLFIQGAGPARPLTYVAQLIEGAKSIGGPAKPVWVSPQAFSYADLGRAGHRAPNFDELRSMMWLAVVKNAKGFLWYAYFSADNYPDIRLGIPFLAREAQALKDGILANSIPIEATVLHGEGEIVACAKFGYDGHYYVIAVNVSHKPAGRVRFVVKPLRSLRSPKLWVASEDRFVIARQGVFEDRFSPYEVHVYSTQPATPLKPTVTEIKAKIVRERQALRTPGNVAYQGDGATAEASSAAHLCYPQHVLDGWKGQGGIFWRDATPDRFPDWIVVNLPQPRMVRRIVLYGTTALDFDVQVARGERWLTLARVLGNFQRRVEVKVPQTRTDRVRILIHKARGSTSQITEIEIFER